MSYLFVNKLIVDPRKFSPKEMYSFYLKQLKDDGYEIFFAEAIAFYYAFEHSSRISRLGDEDLDYFVNSYIDESNTYSKATVRHNKKLVAEIKSYYQAILAEAEAEALAEAEAEAKTEAEAKAFLYLKQLENYADFFAVSVAYYYAFEHSSKISRLGDEDLDYFVNSYIDESNTYSNATVRHDKELVAKIKSYYQVILERKALEAKANAEAEAKAKTEAEAKAKAEEEAEAEALAEFFLNLAAEM